MDDEVLIQLSQRCPVCCDMLYSEEEIITYNGPEKKYKNWMAHKQCCLAWSTDTNQDDDIPTEDNTSNQDNPYDTPNDDIIDLTD